MKISTRKRNAPQLTPLVKQAVMVPKRKLGVLGDVSAMGLGCMGLTWAYASALEGTLE